MEREMVSEFINDLADNISKEIFPHNNDRNRQEYLRNLLAEFAAEIKRSAIGP